MKVVNTCPQCGKHELVELASPEALVVLDANCEALCRQCAEIKGDRADQEDFQGCDTY